MGEEGYSFSLTTFSPSGKLMQIEHALNAVSKGMTSLGIRGTPRASEPPTLHIAPALTDAAAHPVPTLAPLARCDSSSPHLLLSPSPSYTQHPSAPLHAPSHGSSPAAPPPLIAFPATNGVVIATEKRLPSMLIESDTFEKIAILNDSTGVVYSGMGPDFRVLVRKARKKAEAYRNKYKELQPTTQVCREIATVMQQFTQSGGVRPFGVSLLAAGYDHDGPQLMQIDPSGACFGWKATAVGKNFVNAKTFLEKRFNEEMELEDAIHTALLTLKEGFEGEMTEFNIEVGVVGEDKKFRVLSASEVRDYLDEAE